MVMGPCKACAVTADLYRGYCGSCLKDEGIKRVLKRESDIWKQKALDVIRMTAHKHDTFTIDDVKEMAVAHGLEEPHHVNVWGGVFRMALNRGLVYQTGQYIPSERAKQHKHRNPEYTATKPVDEVALWKERAIVARREYHELKKKYEEVVNE